MCRLRIHNPHRAEEFLIAAGGDANHEHVEQVLRGWLVKHSESEQFDDAAHG